MTYCVGMKTAKGIVYMADTRTNSGVDNISVFKKLFRWEVPGERLIVLMTAGNLATTQALVSQLDERQKRPDERRPSLHDVPTMFQAASLVGKMLRGLIENQAMAGDEQRAETKLFNATLILGGQIAGMEPRLYLIYPEGNFIEATDDTPFFQIGETKYGRPILLRGHDSAMSFEDAVKLTMVSFDSTLKANLSVGMPLDFLVQQDGRFSPLHEQRIERNDPYFASISDGWGDALRQAFHSLPDYSFDD